MDRVLGRIPSSADPYIGAVGERVLYAAGRRALRKETSFRAEGLELLPADGPVLIVANHVHHKLDGCALMTAMPRPFRALVTVDWAAEGSATRALLERACQALGWPTVLREDAASRDPELAARMLRSALRRSVEALRRGEPLLVFPEGYPYIDPNPTPKRSADELLPFQPGFARIALMARRHGVDALPIAPAAFRYRPLGRDRWDVTLQIGDLMRVEPEDTAESLTRRVEDRVRMLLDRE